MKLRKRILSLACAFALVAGMVLTAPGAFALEGQWVEMAPMLTGRNNFSMETLNGKLYALGGAGSDATNIYDPATNTWTTGTPMPKPLYMYGTAVYGNKIYVIGGRLLTNFGHSQKSIYIYDTINDTWESGPDMPAAAENCRAEIIGNKLYVMGGDVYSGSSTVPFVRGLGILDLNTNTWSYGSSLNQSYTATRGSCIINDQIYLVTYRSSTSDIYIMHYDAVLNQWQEIAEYPYALSGSSVISVGNDIYLTGPADTVIIFNVESKSWRDGPQLLNTRFRHASTNLNGTIYIAGGNLKGTTILNSMHALTLSTPQTTPKLSVLLNPTETVQLSVTSTLSDNADFTWTSTDAAVATVDANGKVTAIAPGTCDIFAENADGSFKESIPIRVVAGGADLFRLAVHLTPGQSKKLYMTEDPTETTWTSLDSSVATADADGKITAVAPGLVLMQATVGTDTQQIYVRVK